MAELLTTTNQLRLFLGAAYSASSSEDRIKPYLALAEQTYLVKAIGPELLAHLKTVANNEGAASEPNKYLLGLVRRALAFYGYLMYLPYATGVDGDNGLQETKTDKTQPVRQAMLEKRIAATADNASQALEAVLLLLFTQANDYTVWKNSDTYQTACTLFIRNASELKKGCPYTRGHHRLFVSMREYIEERQRKSIVPTLGETFAAGLFERLSDGELTNEEKTLMPYIQRALAYSAYEDALLFLTVVQLPSGGLRILSEFDGINNQRALSDQDKVYCDYKEKIGRDAEAYQRELKRHLDANYESFPDYVPTPIAEKTDTWPVDNSIYKTVIRMR
jgi:hypothetical protein